jgi:hypothetical protein
LPDIDSEIIALFNKADRVQKFSRKEQTRLRRYGNDTLFFRNNSFTFVVKDAKIITIELSTRDLRRFNRADSSEIARHAAEVSLQDKVTPTVFRITAYHFDTERNVKVSNLGSYPLTANNDISKLKKDVSFLVFIKNKLLEKLPSNAELGDVYCSVGRDKERKILFDQSEVQHLLA